MFQLKKTEVQKHTTHAARQRQYRKWLWQQETAVSKENATAQINNDNIAVSMQAEVAVSTETSIEAFADQLVHAALNVNVKDMMFSVNQS